MLYNLITGPHPVLEQPSEIVKDIDSEITEIADYLIGQLAKLDAAGLAAVQFGVLKRVVAIQYDTMTSLVLINPEIVKAQDEVQVTETCQSLPGKTYQLRRPSRVKCRSLDLGGQWLTIKGTGLFAQCLCHEVDHCNGIMLYQIGKLL